MFADGDEYLNQSIANCQLPTPKTGPNLIVKRSKFNDYDHGPAQQIVDYSAQESLRSQQTSTSGKHERERCKTVKMIEFMIDENKGKLNIPRRKHFGALKGVLRDTLAADLFDRDEYKDQQEDFGKEFGYNNNICIECVHLHHCSDDKVLHFQKKETVHFNNIKSKNELAGAVTQSAKSKRV